MVQKIFYVALIATATTYIAYHISFTKNAIWGTNAAVAV